MSIRQISPSSVFVHIVYHRVSSGIIVYHRVSSGIIGYRRCVDEEGKGGFGGWGLGVMRCVGGGGGGSGCHRRTANTRPCNCYVFNGSIEMT